VALAGEQHDGFEHHLAQLATIEALHATGRPVAVGLEMFQQRDQSILDRWVAGELPEKEMIRAFERNWGPSWALYRPIFEFCRENKVTMLGLNVPREITRQVAREGFSSLSKEQRGQLPPVACILDPEYEKELRRVLGPHGVAEASFERFCEAQLVWDTAMAHYTLEYLKTKPEDTVVVLAGYIHAWKRAMPDQIRRLSEDTRAYTFLPAVDERLGPDNVTPGDADYLYLGLEN
jgi:uncharacterized iron-regulated protein